MLTMMPTKVRRYLNMKTNRKENSACEPEYMLTGIAKGLVSRLANEFCQTTTALTLFVTMLKGISHFTTTPLSQHVGIYRFKQVREAMRATRIPVALSSPFLLYSFTPYLLQATRLRDGDTHSRVDIWVPGCTDCPWLIELPPWMFATTYSLSSLEPNYNLLVPCASTWRRDPCVG